MHPIATAIIEVVGGENVSLGAEAERYAWDALGPARGYRGFAELQLQPQPLLIVRPRTTEEVSSVLRLADEQGLPVVPYGGGSGLMGGAISIAPSLVIDLKSMDSIIAINPEDRTVRLQAGVILKQLECQLNRRGLMLGHDPWSLPLATVGGAIATDSLGYRGAKYGSMGDQLLGLVAVLPNGRVVSTARPAKASVGLDVKRLFIGSEGCFGVITEAVIRVFRQPEKRLLRAHQFPSFEDGFQAIVEMCDIGLLPALLDYGERYPAGAPGPTAPTLYLAFEGHKEEVIAQEARSGHIAKAFDGRALGAREARQFWTQRHEAAERYAQRRRAGSGHGQARNASLDYVHVSLPRSQVLGYRRRCQEILQRYEVAPLEYGIWCWPELFSAVIVNANQAEGGGERLATAVDELLMLAQDLGGSMEYCHGVGIRLAHLMAREHGEGLAVARAVKQALDPNGIMNPGKLGL